MPLTQETFTADAYSPDESLESQLTEVCREARIEYESERDIPVSDRVAAKQLSYEIRYDGYTLEGTETIMPFGTKVSLVGNLGCAASVQLANALGYGEPTLLYLDQIPPTDAYEEPYSDLTVEWYSEEAVERGIHDDRLENRPIDYETQQVELATVEQWSRDWLQGETQSGKS